MYSVALGGESRGGVIKKFAAYVCLTNFYKQKPAQVGPPGTHNFIRPNLIDPTACAPMGGLGTGELAALSSQRIADRVARVSSLPCAFGSSELELRKSGCRQQSLGARPIAVSRPHLHRRGAKAYPPIAGIVSTLMLTEGLTRNKQSKNAGKDPRIRLSCFAMVTDGLRCRFQRLEPFLDERGRRLFAANEALSLGRGGISAVAVATGIARSTTFVAVAELKQAGNGIGSRIRRLALGVGVQRKSNPVCQRPSRRWLTTPSAAIRRQLRWVSRSQRTIVKARERDIRSARSWFQIAAPAGYSR